MVGGQLRSLWYRAEAWFSQAQTTDESEKLHRIPAEVETQLADALATLAPPQRHVDWVRDRIATHIKAWRANPQHASNSVVIIGSPIERIDDILDRSLQSELPAELERILPLWPLRSDRVGHSRQDFDTKLVFARPIDEAEADPDADRKIELMVVPALDRHFLRCIQGWDSIESWQAQISRDRDRFWVLGCNHWVWVFLDRVCQISAYLEQIEFLPTLESEDLQTWLAPLIEKITRHPDDPNSADASDAPERNDDAYWQALASLSGGVGSTAAALWLRSLHLRAENLPEDPSTIAAASLTDLAKLAPQLIKPTLPGLPDFEAFDWYLLHSLLLHGGMTHRHLAASLGETDRQIRAHVQALQNQGILQTDGNRLRVNPAHYPKLCSELANNNFLIGKV